MWYNLIYQDYPEGKMMLVSSHRSLQATEKKRDERLADPFWRGYFWSIHITAKRPPRACRYNFAAMDSSIYTA